MYILCRCSLERVSAAERYRDYSMMHRLLSECFVSTQQNSINFDMLDQLKPRARKRNNTILIAKLSNGKLNV